jgi:hypothetical protein
MWDYLKKLQECDDLPIVKTGRIISRMLRNCTNLYGRLADEEEIVIDQLFQVISS